MSAQTTMTEHRKADKELKTSPKRAPAIEYVAEYTKRSAWEFCDVTPIHGCKHFLGSNNLPIERLWWIFVFVVSFYYCIHLVYTIYEEWQRDPIIVSFEQKTSSIYSIPFPAVTICPETKVKTSVLNMSQTFELVRKNKLNETIDEERVRRLLLLLQLCDYNIYDKHETPFYFDDVLIELRRMSIPAFEMFNTCGWKGQGVTCLDIFRTTLTEKGFCYTFNTVANNDLLRKSEIDPRYNLNSETRSSDWELDKGFQESIGVNSFPRRTATGGYLNSLLATLIANKSDLDYLCGDSFQGFKVMLHMPDEFPLVSHQYFRVPLDQELIVTVTPVVMGTDDRVRHYQPDKRQCYYTHERYLRFFKIYNKVNCETECLTNYTFNLCGCVQFWMPHPKGSPVCSLHDSPCYQSAVSHISKMSARNKAKVNDDLPAASCNCLPTCNYVEYRTQVSQAKWNWQNGEYFNYMERKPMTSGVHQSKMVIYFREADFIPLVRKEKSSISGMIANCGGLMGLFMGVSILSLVELIYYCTLRPIAMWMLTKQKISTTNKAESSSRCDCGSIRG
ncbi:pickpocket protein 28-like [Armigeres subalbatus]|uniref:pickpocket protein 28-like n=1 Tax=Armigeres subalbatus TaxID=124917 RepID=UPI002ED0E9FA